MVSNDSPVVQRHSRMWRVGGGLFALLAVWLIAPRTVAASCGDYLAHPQNPLVAHRMSSGPITPQESPDPMRPCQGPSCRRSDTPAPMPTPAPVRLLGERWAAVLDFEVALPLSATFFSRPTEDFVPSALPPRLDRPPKAA